VVEWLPIIGAVVWALIIVANNRRRGAGPRPTWLGVWPILALGAIGWLALLGLTASRAMVQSTQCYRDLLQLALATNMYTQDYNERYPPTDRWSDAVSPYHKSRELYVCPSAPRLRCGYAFNAGLAGLTNQIAAKQPSDIVMLFDARAGWNVSGGPSLLAFRHRGRANVAFVDGRARSVTLSEPAEVHRLIWHPPASGGPASP